MTADKTCESSEQTPPEKSRTGPMTGVEWQGSTFSAMDQFCSSWSH